MRSSKWLFVIVAAAVGLTACGDSLQTPTGTTESPEVSSPTRDVSAATRADDSDLRPVATSIAGINETLAERGAGVRLAKMEWMEIGAAGLDDVPRAAENQQVFADDRNLRLDTRWVPDDPRRDGRNALAYAVDGTFGTATGAAGTADGEPEIDASFDTWNAVKCSDLTVEKQPDPGVIPSTILAGGSTEGLDIGEVGFLPGSIFDLVLGPGASDQVLGVTFTFVFTGPDGEPTDIDGDGNNDTAFKEVWYNDAFAWSADGAPGTQDIQTVALHENGHVLELGHFGKIHATFNQGKGNDKPGTLHVSPRAVMNAINLGTQRELLATDNGAFCGQFASWPQN